MRKPDRKMVPYMKHIHHKIRNLNIDTMTKIFCQISHYIISRPEIETNNMNELN